MSSYKKPTKHPRTGKWLVADWIDDCFGSHEYGVQFPFDANVYKPEYRENVHTLKYECDIETADWDERNTIQGWADKDGIEILDPDGFDRSDQFLFYYAVTKAEYDKGIMSCTVQGKRKEGGKEVVETKRPDGSQDVKITVNRLDIKDPTPEDIEAEKVIMAKLNATKVGVLVVYKPNNDNVYFTCSLPQVRFNAEKVVQSYRDTHPDAKDEDFILIESAVVTEKPKITTL